MSTWHDWIDAGPGDKARPRRIRGQVYALGQGVWVACCQACPFAKPYDTQGDAYYVAERHARQPHMTHEGRLANANRATHR